MYYFYSNKLGNQEKHQYISEIFHGSNYDPKSVVLNLGSIERQGFGESVSGVRRFGSPRSFVH